MIKTIGPIDISQIFRCENCSDEKSALIDLMDIFIDASKKIEDVDTDLASDLHLELKYFMFDACIDYLRSCGIGFHKVENENKE